MEERDDGSGYRQAGQPPQYTPPQQQWAYAPAPGRAPRGGRRTTILASAGALLVGLFIGYSAGHSSTTTTASGSSPIVTNAAPAATTASAGPASTSAPAKPAAPSSAAPAKVGSAIVLAGQSSEKMTVTLVKVTDPAKGADEYTTPAAGKHFVAVQLRLLNSGTVAYQDSPDNGARLVGADGSQFDPTVATTTVGTGFGGHVNVAPGATALGVITFEVPDGAKPAQFQFALDSGFADQTGQWALH